MYYHNTIQPTENSGNYEKLGKSEGSGNTLLLTCNAEFHNTPLE